MSELESGKAAVRTEDVRREPGAWARLWAIRYARIPILICALFFVFALGSECYAIYCHRTGATPIYQVQNPELRNHAPMKGHILGTDYLGRDVLLRAVFATRTAVKVGIVASLISSVVGVALGLISASSRAFRFSFSVFSMLVILRLNTSPAN